MPQIESRINLRHYTAQGFMAYAVAVIAIVSAYALARPEFQSLLPQGELFSLGVVRLVLVLACAALGLAVAGAGNPELGLAVCFAFSGALAMDLHQSWAVLTASDPARATVYYASSNLPNALPIAILLLGITMSRVAEAPMSRARMLTCLALSTIAIVCAYLAVSWMLGWIWTTGQQRIFIAACATGTLALFVVNCYFGFRHWVSPTGVSAGIAMFLSIHVAAAAYTTFRGLDIRGAQFEVLLLDLLAISAIPYGFVLDGIQALSSTRLHAIALRDPARLDPLTGLLNRRAVDTLGKSLFEEAIQAGRPVSILMIDLDHFKDLNDTHGHQAGDFVLQNFGELLRLAVRGTDLVARYGGEEFIVVLPGAPLGPALRLGERIRSATEDHVFQQRQKAYSVTVSVGAATAFPGEITLYADLIDLADRNLYRAKREGRNRVMASPIE